jgi:hypothetical protein
MRGSTKTIKHVHIHVPTNRDVKQRAVSLLNSEKAIDAGLLTMAIMLCGWLVYCLAKPISECQFML